jgi:hypothetical protein
LRPKQHVGEQYRADLQGGPSCLAANLAISSGSCVPAASISMTLRATISQMGSLRSTRFRDRRVNEKARFSRSTSSDLIFPEHGSGFFVPIVGYRTDATGWEVLNF